MIEESHVGVYVNESTTKGGIVLVNNKEPSGMWHIFPLSSTMVLKMSVLPRQTFDGN